MGRTLLNVAARTWRDERGMTLAEILVGLAAFSVVMVAVMGLLDAAVRSAPRDEERANVIREAQAGLHVMTRELRLANKVWTPGRTRMYVNIGDTRHVLYDCGIVHPTNSTLRRCVRWQAAIGQELPLNQPGQVVIDRLAAGDVFTYSPNLVNPTYVKVRVAVPQAGERSDGYKSNLVLDDGLYLRNTDVG